MAKYWVWTSLRLTGSSSPLSRRMVPSRGADWLTAAGVTHVAMDAPGVYWKPIQNVLAQYACQAVLVVNPQQVRGMPGRKTDVHHRQCLASLLRVGMVKGSHIPAWPQRELHAIARV